jgi:hypothetical protein
MVHVGMVYALMPWLVTGLCSRQRPAHAQRAAYHYVRTGPDCSSKHALEQCCQSDACRQPAGYHAATRCLIRQAEMVAVKPSYAANGVHHICKVRAAVRQCVAALAAQPVPAVPPQLLACVLHGVQLTGGATSF